MGRDERPCGPTAAAAGEGRGDPEFSPRPVAPRALPGVELLYCRLAPEGAHARFDAAAGTRDHPPAHPGRDGFMNQSRRSLM